MPKSTTTSISGSAADSINSHQDSSKFSRWGKRTDSSSVKDEIVNNVNRTAIKKIMHNMEQDPELGREAKVDLTAIWKEGVVTGARGQLVCYAPPELQLEADKKGPSIYCYCPLISGACFSLIVMMDAAKHRYHFEAMGTHMRTNADFSGFYNNYKNQFHRDWHPWEDGVELDILIRGHQDEEVLVKLARHADKHCPSSEIMKRDFPVEVARFEKSKNKQDKKIDWEQVPEYYNMEKYREIGKEEKYVVNQFAQMTWHCQNESEEFPESLMTFVFPNDGNSKLALSHDVPISSGKYPSPVAGCFFGGLSSFMHTAAVRIYAHGYKVDEIRGRITAVINKRKVMGVEKDSYVFPIGATMEIEIVTNAPNDVISQVMYECENMSPTMMNWRNELPLAFDVVREDPLLPPIGIDEDIPLEIVATSNLEPKNKFAPFAFLRRNFGGRRKARTNESIC